MLCEVALQQYPHLLEPLLIEPLPSPHFSPLSRTTLDRYVRPYSSYSATELESDQDLLQRRQGDPSRGIVGLGKVDRGSMTLVSVIDMLLCSQFHLEVHRMVSGRGLRCLCMVGLDPYQLLALGITLLQFPV